jgi:hypothetical protein
MTVVPQTRWDREWYQPFDVFRRRLVAMMEPRMATAPLERRPRLGVRLLARRVARHVDARFAEARAIGETIVHDTLAALGERIRDPGTLRFNPSPFERDGVPGLGWRVDGETARRGSTVDPAVADGWVVAGGLSFTFRDEPDVGDLYNYCYAEPNQVAAVADEIRAEGVIEYEVTGDELAVTLLRAVGTISRESMPARPWAAGLSGRARAGGVRRLRP